MSKARAKIIFHIGQHKTGSKALQFFLAHNARSLAQHGILYPVEEQPLHGIRAYAISHYRMFSLLRCEAMAARWRFRASARFRKEQRGFSHPFDSLRSMFESIEAERARTGASIVLLSAEDLFDMHSAHETGFSIGLVRTAAKILAKVAGEFDYDPTVVVYIRRQDHLLGAHYIQYIKGSPVNEIDFESFARIFAPRLRTNAILERWASAFGDAKIHVRPYERAALPVGIVPDFFEGILGFPIPTGWSSPPADSESTNVSPSRDYVEFIRILNRRNVQGFPVPPREDVLEAALRGDAKGIAEWMSPKSRRALLEMHAEGNAEIAGRFLRDTGNPLFVEPLPAENGDWREYPGLSTARINSIEQDIREAVSRR
jgi:hypothetical protein